MGNSTSQMMTRVRPQMVRGSMTIGAIAEMISRLKIIARAVMAAMADRVRPLMFSSQLSMGAID